MEQDGAGSVEPSSDTIDIFGDNFSPANVIDPATVASPGPGAADSGSGSAGSGKRRGRKPGTVASAKAKTTLSALDLSAFAGILVALHSFAEQKVGPEWKMEADEANGIAKATANVMRHYDIKTTQKAIDYAALVSVLAASYGSRLAVTMYAGKLAPKPAAPTPDGAQRNGIIPTPSSVAAFGTVDPLSYPVQ